MIMNYQWDSNKAHINLRKHGIDLADSIFVFEDDRALTIEDDDPDEERFITIGMDALARVLVVVYTYRDEASIRIISARKAAPRERRQYEENYEK